MPFINSPYPSPSPSLSLSLSLSQLCSLGSLGYQVGAACPPPVSSPLDSPSLDSPSLDSPSLDSPSLDSPSVSNPGSPKIGNLSIRTKSRSGSSSSSCTYSSFFSDSSNGSISSPIMEAFTEFQVVDNPADSNAQTMLVSRARLEELEYINENIAAIIEEALKGIRS